MGEIETGIVHAGDRIEERPDGRAAAILISDHGVGPAAKCKATLLIDTRFPQRVPEVVSEAVEDQTRLAKLHAIQKAGEPLGDGIGAVVPTLPVEIEEPFLASSVLQMVEEPDLDQFGMQWDRASAGRSLQSDAFSGV